MVRSDGSIYRSTRTKASLKLTMAMFPSSRAALGPLLTSAFVPLASEFDVPLERFTLGCNGAMIAAIAVGSLVFNTLAVKIGKRPVYLLTSVGLIVTSFWGAGATSFASLVAARTVGGLCMAPMEALVPASIADIWFIHERGYRTAIFNLGVLGGINLASPIGEIIPSSIFPRGSGKKGSSRGEGSVLFWERAD